jgi:YD repeat-containing protein
MELWRNMMKSLSQFLLASVVLFIQVGEVTAAQLMPPKYSVVDKYGVNLVTGQISLDLDTVSIGGAMGLSHNISGFTNNFAFKNFRGYQDKFYGNAQYIYKGAQLGLTVEDQALYQINGLSVLSVHDFNGGAEFKVYINGVHVPNIDTNTAPTSGFTYIALGDTRHKLEVDSADINYLNWTKPDGTIVKFRRDSYLRATSSGSMEKIIYPNGFMITISGLSSVRTNTGFQLKYIYESDNRPFGKTDKYLEQAPGLLSSSPLSDQWWRRNPKYIKALNSAIDYCTDDYTSCAFTKTWPTATFNWPAGMPRSIYIDSSVFSVVDASSRTTEYYFEAQDLAYDRFGQRVQLITPNTRFSPRVVDLKLANSTVKTQHFSYINVVREVDRNAGFMDFALFYPDVVLDTDVGQIIGASKYGEGTNYNLGRPNAPNSPDGENQANSINGGPHRVGIRGKLAGNLMYVHELEGSAYFEASWRNFLTSYSPVSGPGQALYYDARGNLNKIAYSNGRVEEALFPTSCTNTKTCNQPLWTKDAKGNQTDYTYHSESGQVATVTSPPNKNGVAAVTRYGYEQKFARYIQSPGAAKTTAPTGIWLKTSEKICMKTATVGDACAGGASDEVVTRFEYNHDNLLLTGMTVLATGTSPAPKRTCYQYDIYGNRIGETQPNANRTSCN